MNALLYDCPYSLYWFDKTSGVALGAEFTTRGNGSIVTYAKVTSLYFLFSVVEAYQPESDYDDTNPTVDIAKTSAATTAVTNANAIVNRYAALSDYEKLVAYRNEICNLVSYNYDAISKSHTGGYGDPWQMIYVFDNDSTTNVVCEGYAKAFQYLCDQSTFSGNIVCYTVSGYMRGGTDIGGHMWNIVTMEDGKNYLVDITNSDTNTIGQNGGLFLAGTPGSIGNGYQFNLFGSYTVQFIYDQSECIDFWGTGTDSILKLAAANYTPTGTAGQVRVLSDFANTLTVTKSQTATATILTVKPIGSRQLPVMSLYTAVYGADEKLIRIEKIQGTYVNNNLVFSAAKPSMNTTEAYKIMLWTNTQIPIITAD